MSDERKALRTDGRRWYVQRKYASPAFLERLGQHVERRYLTHDHTSGGVEVYRVEPEAPFYNLPIEPTSARIRALIDDAVTEAADERWDSLRAALVELATACKGGGVTLVEWGSLMRTIESRAVTRTGDPSLILRMRQAIRARNNDGRLVL